MNRTTAFGLADKALAAGMNADVRGIAAHKEDKAGVMTDIPEDFQLYISSPSGNLGPAILKALSDAGVSLASSDVLLK